MRFEYESPMPVGSMFLYDYHSKPGAFDRLQPPWEQIKTVEATGGIRDDAVRLMRIKKGPLGINWKAVHHGHVPGQCFQDRQEQGPFAAWNHLHQFIEQENGSLLRDQIDLELPLGPLGRLGEGQMQNMLEKMFRFRHRRTRDDLMRLHRYDSGETLTVVFVGRLCPSSRNLASLLSCGGHRVYVMNVEFVNGQERFLIRPYLGDGYAFPLEDADAIIHTQRPYHRDENALTYADYLIRALGTMPGKARTLINLYEYQPQLERYTRDPSLDFSGRSRLAHYREKEAMAEVVELLEPFFNRNVDVHLGTVIRSPFQYMVDVVLHMETYLFLKDGSRTLEFGWMAQDDVVGALLHILYHDEIEGEVSICNKEWSTRAELQELLLSKSFWHYSWCRMLKVLPWATPGLAAGMRHELLNMRQITELGFIPFASDLSSALSREFGDI